MRRREEREGGEREEEGKKRWEKRWLGGSESECYGCMSYSGKGKIEIRAYRKTPIETIIAEQSY